MNFFSRKLGIILITCFVLGFFAIQIQSPTVALALTAEELAEAEGAAAGGGANFIDENYTAPESNDGPPSVGERLQFTKWNLTIFNMLSSLGVLVAWLGGSLLDATIGVFTVGMYETSEYFQLDRTIQTMWGIIRDIFNLLFIFGLIFAGFKLILGKDDSGSKKMIGSIIVAALLINFSLYAAQVVVDFSNVVAYQINELIQPPETTVVLGGWSVPNISTSFTQLTNLDQLGNQSGEMAEVAGLGVDTFGAAIVLGILFTVFYSVLGFVFAAGAFVLFSRFITLIFLMIFSPIMFLGFIFPNFKEYSSKWLKLLMNQALVGPAFLFMLYLSLQALSGLASIPPSQFTIINLTIYLLIVVAFLWGSLMVARSMSNWGALQAYNAGDVASKYARRVTGGTTAGLAGRGLRASVGKWSQGYAESDKAKDRAANSWVGRRALNVTSKLGDSSFDARKVGGVGKKLGLGEGLKEGYATKTKNIIEREKKYAERLGPVSENDERVSNLQIDIEASEQMIKDKKKEIKDAQLLKKNATTDDDRNKIQADIDLKRSEIETYEEDLQKRKEVLQSEKYRRQLGTIPTTTADSLKAKRDQIKTKLVDYEKALPEDKGPIREEIARLKKELAEAEKEASKEAGGYATTIESYGRVKNWFISRNKDQNNEAGKEIRKEYKSKVKSKEN
ncbi:hypothetical protein H6788_01525 [Candidatus Nomurabacteria bacterium]|nr:hypothetical protein [Candidatus Nomurabacteria bacterium]MCB9819622.1 hypothetical protein [Candidatus Nomurabacteria bacterium]